MKTLFLIAACLLWASVLDAQIIRKIVPPSLFETVTIAYTANTRGLHTADQTEAPASALVTMIGAVRHEYGNLLLVDLGNFMGPTPSSILTEGRFDFAVMERLGYDLLHVSSDEFVTGTTNLEQRLAETRIPVLTGNLNLTTSSNSDWTILQTGSRKVGFIGVTSPDFTNLVMANMRKDIKVAAAEATISKAVLAMDGKADIIVALTDLNETELTGVRNIPGLDLILTTGGDEVKPGSDWISFGFPGAKRAAIARVLSTATAVHVLTIHGYPDQNKWTIDEIVGAVYVVTEETPRDKPTELWLKDQTESIYQANNHPLGNLLAPLFNEGGRSRQTALGQAVTDLMRSRTKAHLALVDSGGLRAGLPQGPISDWDLTKSVPYPDQIVVVRLTGTQINKVIARSKTKVGEDGYLQFSNLQTEPVELGNRIGSLKVVPGRSYLVAMPEFLAEGGDGYKELKGAPIVDRIPLSLAELCHQAFLDYGSLVPGGLPMDQEDRFWFASLHLAASVDGFISDPGTSQFYPDQVSMVELQQITSAFDTRLEVDRMTGLVGFENFVEGQYGMSWDQNWVPIQTLDDLQVGSQVTIYLSNLLFGGDRIADPYFSAALDTALVYPDPTDTMFTDSLWRPGTLKLGVGVAATTLLRPLSLKLGFSWVNQPFDPQFPTVMGLEGIVACATDVIDEVLSFDTSTDVFYSLNSPPQGVTVSSVNDVLFHLEDNLKIGPRLQLYFNSLVGHWAYLLDFTLVLDITLK